VIVIGGVPIGRFYPTGGDNITYRLASGLTRLGIRVVLVSPINVDELIPDYNPVNATFKSRLVHFFMRRFPFIFEYYPLYYNRISHLLFKIDYDFSILKNVPMLQVDVNDKPKFRTKIIMATAWPTAYYVKFFVENLPDTKPLYLIQNSEDDPSISGSNFERARRTYGFNLKKIVINKKMHERFQSDDPYFFHVGIDAEFYHIMYDQANREYVIFPLIKAKYKGAKYALDVIDRLLNNDKKIKVAAFGNFEREEIPAKIRDRIDYFKRPTNEVLRSLYNKSMIFCLPSIVEGMSLVLLEAMACGCAAVTTDNGGISEFIVNNVNGLICPVANPDCLYDAIMKLLEDSKLRDEISKRGHDTALQFSYENMINSFRQIITGILES